MIKSIVKKQVVLTCITRYAQRPQTSADLEHPDFGLWTPGSEA